MSSSQTSLCFFFGLYRMKNLARFVFLVFAILSVFSVGARAEEIAKASRIVPHRAIYKMSLGKVKNGSAISSVAGSMIFDWTDMCDGWAIQQHLKLHFTYAEGDEGEVDSTVVTWESKDGKRYNFNVRRLTNGEEDEIYKGRATLEAMGGAAVYALPADKENVALVKDTLFPSAHTEMILTEAVKGTRLFTRPVFDGSDAAGYAYVSAFIGKEIEKPQDVEMNPDLKANPLLAQPAWPVRLAFYQPEDQTGQPDYEMDLVLQANGVARAMTIDYGDFSVTGLLTAVEPATDVSCPAAR